MSHDAHATTITAAAEAATSQPEPFDIDTGVLCLDFVNTLDGRVDPLPRERLSDYTRLLAFAQQAGALDDAGAALLAQSAAQRPDDAAAALARALDLREALFRLFRALTSGGSPADADLAAVNAAQADASVHGAVTRAGERFVWTWDADPRALDRPLWPIVSDAVALLLHGDLGRLRQCAAHDCAWLFLDTSRNHSRRWCSMSSCGNRAKVGSFRERKRGAGKE